MKYKGPIHQARLCRLHDEATAVAEAEGRAFSRIGWPILIGGTVLKGTHTAHEIHWMQPVPFGKHGYEYQALREVV